jgi:hypothetical protein
MVTELIITHTARAPIPGGDRLIALSLHSTVNVRVEVGGVTVRAPVSIPLPQVESFTFTAERISSTQPFMVEYSIRDLCGDVKHFEGAGVGSAGNLHASPTATPTVTALTPATPPPSAIPTWTLTATPTVTMPAPATPPSSTIPTPNPSGAITPATLRLTATFNSISIELPFTGDPNGNATVGVDFRRANDSTWRHGLPLWRTDDSSGPAFYGSVLLLDPGTEYELRVAISDPDGVAGSAVQTATQRTRAETIGPAGSLTPTHYVRTSGSDAADGLSPGTAWRTIDKAVQAAPSGAVVQVGPGYFATSHANAGNPRTGRAAPLTLVAQYPAVDDGRAPINEGARSVIEPVGLSAPSGATDGPNPGAWRSVSLHGPRTGEAYTVWHWSGSPVTDARQLGYATSRAGSPTRLAHWARDAADLATPAGWAEKLYTNLTYNYGFYAAGQDVYVRLPGDRDPNTLYITMSGLYQAALAIHGPDVRVSGFEIRQFDSGIEVLWGARNAVIDHNLLTGNLAGVLFRGNRSLSPPEYGSDHVVQDNLILDSSLWSTASADTGAVIPWHFIKTRIRNPDGSDYPTPRIGGLSESGGVTGRGGARRVVIRRNTIDGPFDGVRAGYNVGFDRYAAQDMDVADNLIRHIADDALEPDGSTINFRAWSNRAEESLTVLSTGPVSFGPVYLVRNTAWRTGNDGVGRDGQGRVPGTTMIKYSGSSSPIARVYLLHNTFWTDRPNVVGGAQFASLGASSEAFYLRNNLIRTTNNAFDVSRAIGSWDEDADHFASTGANYGLRFKDAIYRADVQAYRTASGQGAHTNLTSDFVTDLALLNPDSGDLRLPPGSPLVDAGIPVPNISDRPGLDFLGSAPDIGAVDR